MQILNYMWNLGISREEAEQLYKDEQENNLPELTSDQKKVEKEMRQADRKIETARRVKERKPDTDKRILISTIKEILTDNDIQAENVIIINHEREIEFDYNNIHYRLVLMKPRKEKK